MLASASTIHESHRDSTMGSRRTDLRILLQEMCGIFLRLFCSADLQSLAARRLHKTRTQAHVFGTGFQTRTQLRLIKLGPSAFPIYCKLGYRKTRACGNGHREGVQSIWHHQSKMSSQLCRPIGCLLVPGAVHLVGVSLQRISIVFGQKAAILDMCMADLMCSSLLFVQYGSNIHTMGLTGCTTCYGVNQE